MTNRQLQTILAMLYWGFLALGLLVLCATPPYVLPDLIIGGGFTTALTGGWYFIATRLAYGPLTTERRRGRLFPSATDPYKE